MVELLYGYDREVAAWVAEQLNVTKYEPCTAIGIVKNGLLIGGVIYNNLIIGSNGKPVNMEMAIATVDKSWCLRHILQGLFGYPFNQLGLKRVQATTAKRNKKTRRFLDKLGFTLEGVGRQAWVHGGDCVVYSMLRWECKWIAEHRHGETYSLGTTSARPQ